MSYNGWLIEDNDKSYLLDKFPPRYPDVLAHHVTEKRGRKEVPAPVWATIVGYADDGKGCECYVVEINGSVDRERGGHYHITWSIDRSLGRKPVDSNTVLENGFTAIDPVVITVVPFYHGDDGVDYV